MHNAAYCVIAAIEHVKDAMQAIGAEWQLVVIDDNSDQAELDRVYTYLCRNRGFQTSAIIKGDTLWPTPAPNLGRALNYCLNLVGTDADYYLNLESDIYLQPDCLHNLIVAMQETGAPMACPAQLAFNQPGFYDFIFWGGGIISATQLSTVPQLQPLMFQQRPKWCNLGCLLVRGDVARNRQIRVDEQFELFCVDQDYTSTVAQVYGRPVYEPRAIVTHVGRQSTREGQPGGHTADDAVRRINQKWAAYLAGGLFGG